MPTPSRRSLPRSFVAACAFGLVAAPLALVAPAQASTDGSKVVISEVYGGGGNSGATLNQDFVELYNPTAAAINLSGTSVQYRSATGSGNPSGVIALTGDIPSHGHYLIGGSKGDTGAAIPTPNTSSSVNLSASHGTVLLADQPGALATLPTGSVVDNPSIIDLVGFGDSNTFETAPSVGAPDNASSVFRSAGADTDNNSADFSAGTPSPEAAAATPPPARVDATIEQIQGAGDVSPLADDPVTTTGVVTAAYPTGGFSGFYIQTPGTGGDIDLATHDTSDAVFVYGSMATDQVAIGDHVKVLGTVKEYYGLTEVNADIDGVSVLNDAAQAVKPTTVVWPRTDASRESLEGMLLDPQGDYTVADNYSLNNYAEIGLAAGTTPLLQPTDVARPGSLEYDAVVADNAARGVVLDDGSSTNYLTSGKNTPLPYLSATNPIRVGAPATFTHNVVLDYRNNAWAFQPLEQLTATGDAPATFANTRTPHPADVGGDLKIASFNVLNYFPTTGEEYVAAGGSCTYYDDRDGNHITDNNCTEGGADGPRGAATDASLKRQQDKIVAAINALGADVVSLEEIENSAKFGEDRDAAVSTLVTALNAAAGSDVWAFAPTPSTSGDQTPEDVIRTAFIYKQAAVQPVGESEILQDPAFDNARDPLGQGFKPVGAGDDQKIAVIVNHFKSKGSGSGDDADQGDGQGASNASRVKQATALVAFADKVKTDVGTDKVFLSGDFNSYTQEDPMQVLYQAGYTDIGSALHPDEHTYLFGGVVGSLDHVLANSAAMATVTGAHVWNINSVESVAMEYSRYNYNATNFYVPDQYRASDHDPLLVGITLGRTPPVKATPHIDVRVLQKHVKVGRTKPHVKVHLSARHLTVTGSVAVYRGKRLVDVAKLRHEKVMFTLAPYRSTGTKTITVRYLGNRDLARASKSITIRVVR